jgi:ArsR family transcriptional regulator
MMRIRNREIFDMHAELCRTLSNSKRLMIITILFHKTELNVGEIATVVGAPITNISQHLRALKNQEIVTSRKDGQTVFYRLTDDRLVQACETLRKVLLDRMRERGRIASDLEPIVDDS